MAMRTSAAWTTSFIASVDVGRRAPRVDQRPAAWSPAARSRPRAGPLRCRPSASSSCRRRRARSRRPSAPAISCVELLAVLGQRLLRARVVPCFESLRRCPRFRPSAQPSACACCFELLGLLLRLGQQLLRLLPAREQDRASPASRCPPSRTAESAGALLALMRPWMRRMNVRWSSQGSPFYSSYF